MRRQDRNEESNRSIRTIDRLSDWTIESPIILSGVSDSIRQEVDATIINAIHGLANGESVGMDLSNIPRHLGEDIFTRMGDISREYGGIRRSAVMHDWHYQNDVGWLDVEIELNEEDSYLSRIGCLDEI
jgi:hypothetical protein